jgi:hypothetical protein
VTCGDPSIWLKNVQGIHDKVLQSIVDVWPDCAKRFDSNATENKITDQLAWMLRQNPRVRNVFRIEPQYKLLDSCFNGDVVTKGFIDFVVIFDMNQENYIAYECKRLNVNFVSGFESLADKYVDEGLMRYVKAQYAQEMPFGVMIGYVLDSDVPAALAAVKSQVLKKKAKLLCFDNPPTSDLPTVSFASQFASNHIRTHGVIEVHHLLLALKHGDHITQ